MELVENNFSGVSYFILDAISDNAMYVAAKTMMHPHPDERGPGLAFVVSIIAKGLSLFPYYYSDLSEHQIHPIPSMSYAGLKGVFGGYIYKLLGTYTKMKADSKAILYLLSLNVATVAEYFIFEEDRKSALSNPLCDYSWMEKNSTLNYGETGLAYNTAGPAFFDLLGVVPNILLKFATPAFMHQAIDETTFRKIFLGSAASLLIQKLVLLFGDEETKFIRQGRLLNSRPHAPIVSGMALGLFMHLLKNELGDGHSQGIGIIGASAFIGLLSLNTVTNKSPDAPLIEETLSDNMKGFVFLCRTFGRTLALEPSCPATAFANGTHVESIPLFPPTE